MSQVKIKRLENGKDLQLPSYETANSAGMDIRAAEEKTIQPGEIALIKTGLAMALPSGYEAQIRPRSGLALKKGITVLNTPGTIDADYRGEIGVILINHSKETFSVERGMRIAQVIIAPCVQVELQEVEDLDKTDRGAGGFGSTGV